MIVINLQVLSLERELKEVSGKFLHRRSKQLGSPKIQQKSPSSLIRRSKCLEVTSDPKKEKYIPRLFRRDYHQGTVGVTRKTQHLDAKAAAQKDYSESAP